MFLTFSSSIEAKEFKCRSILILYGTPRRRRPKMTQEMANLHAASNFYREQTKKRRRRRLPTLRGRFYTSSITTRDKLGPFVRRDDVLCNTHTQKKKERLRVGAKEKNKTRNNMTIKRGSIHSDYYHTGLCWVPTDQKILVLITWPFHPYAWRYKLEISSVWANTKNIEFFYLRSETASNVKKILVIRQKRISSVFILTATRAFISNDK